MRKIISILTFISLSSLAFAQEVTSEPAETPAADTVKAAAAPMTAFVVEQQAVKVKEQVREKTWSFYGNFGVGYSTPVTLEGLSMSAEDMAYFKQRNVTPSFKTQGTAKVVPTFKVGASYYFYPFRVSLDMGSQYVNQTNYHANNFNLDGMFGFSPLKGNHEFNIDLGLGYYALWNDYYYSWTGYDSKGNVIYVNGVPEHKEVYLGRHDVHTLSIPFKLSYLYNIADRHWLGCYFHGRVNCAPENFCPRFACAAGIEYRFTLGKRKAKQPRQQVVCAPCKVPCPVPMCSPCPAMCQPIQQCPAQQPKTIKGGSYHYNPVYSPIYIVVSPGANISIETPEGTKINASAPAAQTTVAAPAAQAPVAAAPKKAQKYDGSLADGRIMVLFEIGSDVITQTAKSILDAIDFADVEYIEVEASTCAQGSKSVNEQLSKKRLDAIKGYLNSRGYNGAFLERQSHNDAPDPDWRAVFLRLKMV